MASEKRFTSQIELIAFANEFCSRHVKRFKKDIGVCLQAPNHTDNNQAYFPALMACVGFLELFSGLYRGNLDSDRKNLKKDLKIYARRFLPSTYSDLLLSLLYQCFRHKVAHLAHPYDVLDTGNNNSDFPGQPRRRIAWVVSGDNNADAMRLEQLNTPKTLSTAPLGWNVHYDHVMHISVAKLANDAIISVHGDSGYFRELANSQECQNKFQHCMNQYFST